MNNDTGCFFPAVFLGVAVMFSPMVAMGTYGCTNQAWKRKAVKQGHAEYYLDENNTRQWRWKEPSDDQD